MQKSKTLRNNSSKEFSSSSTRRKSARLQIKQSPHLPEGSYFAQLERGTIEISAADALVEQYAEKLLSAGLESAYISECLGECSPRCKQRILSFEGKQTLKLDEGTLLAVPNCIDDTAQHELFASRVTEWGYNAVLFASFSGLALEKETESVQGFSKLCQCLTEKGIRVYVAVQGKAELACPLHEDFASSAQASFQAVFEALPGLSGVLWTSGIGSASYESPRESRDWTYEDLLVEEAQSLERVLEKGKELIFYLPHFSSWSSEDAAQAIMRLSNELGLHSHLAFSPVSAEPTEVFSSPHSVWTSLREARLPLMTPLLPIVNVGALRHGEGLWPFLFMNMWDAYIGACQGGAIITTSSIPEQGSLLDGSLWIAGRQLWKQGRSADYLDFWAKAYGQELALSDHGATLQLVEQVLRVCSLFHESSGGDMEKEALRSEVEWTLAVLDGLRMRHRLAGPADEDNIFQAYLRYFIRDGKRILFNALKERQITIPSMLNGDDLQEAFWSETEQGPSRGLSSGAKVTLRSTPYKGKEEGQGRIFDGSRLIT